jgi:flagellar hook-associated protein 1 FlgK
MGDLLSVLQSAASSLSAARGAAQTASNNLENVNTPGYSRQTAVIQAFAPSDRIGGATLGNGAVLSTVTQSRDRFVEAQLPVALGSAASSQAQNDTLQGVTAFDPSSTDGVPASLGTFYSALRALQQDPSDPALRQAALAGAQTLAQSFNQASSSIAAARNAADSQLQSTLPQVNQLASQIASLNQQISQQRGLGGTPNELLDARQQAQDQLVQLTGAVPVADNSGNVNLALSDGTALVSGASAAQLSAVPDATNGGHLALRITHTDGTGPSSVQISSGTLGGLITARDGALKSASTGLDQLASAVAGTINTAHAAGFAEDGSTGRPLFTGTAGAATISVNADIAKDPTLFAAAGDPAAVSGDAVALQQMIATETQASASGSTPEGAAAQLTSAFGAAQQSAQATSDHDAAVSTQLTTLRASTSGVSVDEETINLTQAQQGYTAIARVITAANACFDALFAVT